MAEPVRGKKRRNLEAKILSKAHSYVDPPNPSRSPLPEEFVHDPETEAEIHKILNPKYEVPVKKIRKPRHTEKKPKPLTPDPEAPTKTKQNKKKKKKRKSAPVPISEEKAQESLNRHNNEALAYLQRWKSCPSEWKFEKLKQTWLLRNCTDSSLVPDNLFPILLEYVGSVKGRAKESTEKDMKNILETVVGLDGGDGGDVKKLRAKEIMQIIISE